MRTYAYQISAGESIYVGGGDYLLILESTASLSLKFIDKKKGEGDLVQDAPKGFWVKSPAPFDSVEIYSAETQSINIGVSYGDGGIIGESGGGVITPIPQYVSHFTYTGTTATHTVVAPAANANGVRIDATALFAYAGGSYGAASILAKSSVPVDYKDGAAVVLAYKGPSIGWLNIRRPDQIILPAGMGLFVFISSSSYMLGASVDYEIL